MRTTLLTANRRKVELVPMSIRSAGVSLHGQGRQVLCGRVYRCPELPNGPGSCPELRMMRCTRATHMGM